jgi:hypothetical protein
MESWNEGKGNLELNWKTRDIIKSIEKKERLPACQGMKVARNL